MLKLLLFFTLKYKPWRKYLYKKNTIFKSFFYIFLQFMIYNYVVIFFGGQKWDVLQFLLQKQSLQQSQRE